MNRRLVGVLIMSWMFLSGMIGTGLVGPNRSSIEREFSISHGQFGLAVAAIQITASCLALCVGPAEALEQLPRPDAGARDPGAGLRYHLLSPPARRAGDRLGVGQLRDRAGRGNQQPQHASVARQPPQGSDVAARRERYRKDRRSAPSGGAPGPGLAFELPGDRGLTGLVLAAFFLVRRKKGGIPEQPVRDGASRRAAVWGNPFYWLSILPFGMIAGGEAAFVTLMPVWFEQGHCYTPQAASLLLTIHLAGLASGRFLSGALHERIGNAIIAGCLAAGLFVFPALLSGQPGVVYPALYLMGFMFSSTWPTVYAQVARFHTGHRDMLAYGSSVSNVVGISSCVLLSSLIADHSLRWSLLFGLIYYTTRLSAREALPCAAAEGAQA